LSRELTFWRAVQLARNHSKYLILGENID